MVLCPVRVVFFPVLIWRTDVAYGAVPGTGYRSGVCGTDLAYGAMPGWTYGASSLSWLLSP
eukprot:3697156-Rhodomonas_salina.3